MASPYDHEHDHADDDDGVDQAPDAGAVARAKLSNDPFYSFISQFQTCLLCRQDHLSHIFLYLSFPFFSVPHI